MIRCFCYASGQIGFAETPPKGAIVIAVGPDEKSLREFIDPVSRHAYDGKTLLVPGVPEAADQSAAFDAMVKFLDWIRPHNKPKGVRVL